MRLKTNVRVSPNPLEVSALTKQPKVTSKRLKETLESNGFIYDDLVWESMRVRSVDIDWFPHYVESYRWRKETPKEILKVFLNQIIVVSRATRHEPLEQSQTTHFVIFKLK